MNGTSEFLLVLVVEKNMHRILVCYKCDKRLSRKDIKNEDILAGDLICSDCLCEEIEEVFREAEEGYG